jgi:hypothetical protein
MSCGTVPAPFLHGLGEPRPVVDDAVVVAQKAAVDEHHHAERLDELRGGRDELDGLVVIRKRVSDIVAGAAVVAEMRARR